MSLPEDDLPVLSAVVESGNRSIIQSTRLGNEVLRELESLRQDAVRSSASYENHHTPTQLDAVELATAPEDTDESDTLPDNLVAVDPATIVEIPQGLDFASLSTRGDDTALNDELADPLLDDFDDSITLQSVEGSNFELRDEEIEIMIDDIVDRHITSLRRDIKRLLERARSSP